MGVELKVPAYDYKKGVMVGEAFLTPNGSVRIELQKTHCRTLIDELLKDGCLGIEIGLRYDEVEQ